MQRSPIRTSAGRLFGACLLAALLTGGVAAQTPGPPAPGGPPAGFGPRLAPPPDPATYPHEDFAGGVRWIRDATYTVVSGFRPLKLDLYLNPAQAGLKPLVIWVHGGGFAAGDPTDRGVDTPAYRNWPKALAELAGRGYVVAAVSYRLSGEAKFPAAVEDVKAAIRWLRTNATLYGIDPGRVLIWGGSAGGQIASLVGTSCGVPEFEGKVSGTAASSCVQGVVDFYGLVDFARLEGQGPDSRESRYLGCDVRACPAALLRQASPISFIDASDPPFLIVHGSADRAVPLSQSQELDAALRARKVPSELVVVPGADHIFIGATDAQGRDILDRVYAFFDRISKRPSR